MNFRTSKRNVWVQSLKKGNFFAKQVPDSEWGTGKTVKALQKISSEDWNKVKPVNEPKKEQQGVKKLLPVVPTSPRLGEQVPEADLTKAYADLSGLSPGDEVAIER